MTENEPFPEQRPAETGVTLLAAAVAAVPVIGGTAAEFVKATVAPVIQRRQIHWLNDLAEQVGLLGLRIDGWTNERLKDDESFASAVMAGLDAVRRTQHEEKLIALRNAVINSVTSGGFVDDERSMFLRMVDELQPLHFRLLGYFADPVGWDEHYVDGVGPAAGTEDHILQMFPEADPLLLRQAARELEARGLATTGGFASLDGGGYVPHTVGVTNLYRRLRAFITLPDGSLGDVRTTPK